MYYRKLKAVFAVKCCCFLKDTLGSKKSYWNTDTSSSRIPWILTRFSIFTIPPKGAIYSVVKSNKDIAIPQQAIEWNQRLKFILPHLNGRSIIFLILVLKTIFKSTNNHTLEIYLDSIVHSSQTRTKSPNNIIVPVFYSSQNIVRGITRRSQEILGLKWSQIVYSAREYQEKKVGIDNTTLTSRKRKWLYCLAKPIATNILVVGWNTISSIKYWRWNGHEGAFGQCGSRKQWWIKEMRLMYWETKCLSEFWINWSAPSWRIADICKDLSRIFVCRSNVPFA